jgi:hypothetical protein
VAVIYDLKSRLQALPCPRAATRAVRGVAANRVTAAVRAFVDGMLARDHPRQSRPGAIRAGAMQALEDRFAEREKSGGYGAWG